MFSEMITPRIASIVIFLIFLAVVIWKDRDNIERHSLLIVRRTKKGIELIKRVAGKFPKLWKRWSTAGVFLSFLVTIFGFLFLGYNVLKALFEAGIDPAIGLVLPTISQTPSMSPGVFFIPFWYWIIGIATVMVVHEMMHGVVGINEGFKIKSVGWLLLVILPGAFVEPEGEEMLPEKGEKSSEDDEDVSTDPWGEGPVMSKLRVLAAGSWANICFAIIVGLTLFAVTTTASGEFEVRNMYQHEGVRVAQVVNESPAYQQGLEENMVIHQINGKQIKTLMDFGDATRGLKPNESIYVAGDFEGDFFEINLTTGDFPETNMTYEPAILDNVFLRLENIRPGTYETYMRFQDFFTDYSDYEKIARWEWIKEQGILQERADEEIGRLEDGLEPRGYFGINILSEKKVEERFESVEPIATYFVNLMIFLVMIHSGVAIANLLPLIPLDGGWMMAEVVKKYKPEWENFPKYLSLVTLGLFLLTLLLPIFL